jgi:exosome complex RNA-binding protein Rrp4
MRYGKLDTGQFVTAQSSLVKRARRHFHTLDCGVHIILGNNGYVFLSILAPGSTGVTEGPDATALQRAEPDAKQRQTIARVRNAIVALDQEFIAISPETIMSVFTASEEELVRVPDMLRPDVARGICSAARELREVA